MMGSLRSKLLSEANTFTKAFQESIYLIPHTPNAFLGQIMNLLTQRKTKPKITTAPITAFIHLNPKTVKNIKIDIIVVKTAMKQHIKSTYLATYLNLFKLISIPIICECISAERHQAKENPKSVPRTLKNR